MVSKLACLAGILRSNISPRAASFRDRRIALAAAVCAALCVAAQAQTNPTPNTFSTYAGGYTGTYTVGATCGGATSGSKFTALDTFGNGCPLTQAILGPSLSGIGVDSFGNVFVEDYSNGQVRKIDAKSGIVTRLTATANTLCSSTATATGQVQDSIGSGCSYATAKGPATARGMNVDVYGNVIYGSYNSNMINVLCLATSPLCPGTTGRKQVGFFYRVAGCVTAQASGASAESSTTAYGGGDNSLASPYQNLAGDVAAWGLTGTAAANATVGATTQVCSGTTSGSVNQARNAQADKYGNVYIADTNGDRYRVVLGPASYNGVTNPLFAIINMNPKYTANEGYIYTILGGFSAFTMNGTTYNIPTASGQACSSASTTVIATDGLGDGCAFFETGKPSAAATPAGLGVDKDGNPIFSDTQDSVIRVLYVGGATTANIIAKNNGGITPVPGYVYAIEGTGTATKGGTPQLNVSSASISSGNTKVAVDGQGNIYTNDGTGVNIIDAVTGYLRRPISTGGTDCSVFGTTSSNGDGCPTGQGASWTSLSSVGTAIALDNLGNMYLADSTGRVRKILAGSIYPTPVGSTFTQNIVLHEPAGTTGITATLINAAPGFSIPATAPVCTLYTTSSDNTADCTIVVTFAPTVAGKVGATLSATNIGGGGATTLYQLEGTATDAALVTDIATPLTTPFATAGQLPTSLAIDTAGNIYTVDRGSSNVYQFNASGTLNATVGTAPPTANQVAVDAAGNVYVTTPNTSTITRYTLTGAGTYSTSTFTVAGVARPQGIAIDALNNLYVSDATTASVYQVPNDAGYATLQLPTAIVTGLANPTFLTFDGSGNLIIADTGIVYRFNAETSTLTTVASSAAGGVAISGLVPAGIAADSGNNIYIQDGASKSIYEVPYQAFTPGDVTVLTGETVPNGITVDGAGNIYAADPGLYPNSVIKVKRAAEAYTFPTATTVFSGTFTNAGNANSTGYSQTDPAEFPYTGTGSGGCGSISATSPLVTGTACTFTVTPMLGNNGQLVTSTTTLFPLPSIGSLALTAQEPSGTTYTTTTTVTGPSTAVYVGSGTDATFTVSEVASNSTSQNGENVKVSIDSGATTNYTLANGSVSVPVSGLTVGSHTIVATYPGDGTYLFSTSNTLGFNITQASTSVSWTPAASTTQPYSTAIGTSVLNATSTTPGAFIYTATSGATTQYINSASYLPIGSYTLGVTFVPNDAVNYAGSTGPTQSYTVSKATTSAPVGATQFLVASDGTGNFTSMQSAVNALPGGGSIYIKPGTYTGNIAVVQPNISFRGLGGDPTQVILSHSGGAFGNGQVQNQYAGEFTAAQNNSSQLPAGSSVFTGDEASATLVVAKGVNTALSTATQIPNNFYSENLTLLNTYNTASTLTNTYVTGGACTANTTQPQQTYSALFNAGIQCASQALAIWTTSDLSVMNNVYTTSLQDTIYTASQGSGSSGYVPARQYWFRGKVTGNVDFIFGDAAAVFDSTSIYTAWHGTTATGTETIHAQSKAVQTGATGDYLSGYIMNNDVFTSQSTGMTQLYFGRPYNTYSTWIMLNSFIDQVNPLGYTTGLGPALAPTTFTEFNDIPYTDPAVNAPDLNGVLYNGANATGGNTGTGVTGPRESSSTNPGTLMANDNPPTAMTRAQAQAYFPTNFLSQTVSSAVSTTQNWNPTAALAANVNAFVPSTSPSSVASGSSITLLMRPQTPGLGAIVPTSYSASSPTPTTFTIPTGTYTLTDSFNGGTAYIVASGTLDASGEAYFTTSNLSVGTHSFTLTYSGDSNFSGSSTATAYALTVTGTTTSTTTTLSTPTSPITYGQSTSVTATVTPTSGTATGAVTLYVDGVSNQTATLVNGAANFTISGLVAGTHSLTATYAGNSTYAASSTTANTSVVVNKAALTVTGACANRVFDQANACSATVTGGYQYSDTVSTVFTAVPTATTTAVRNSPAATGYVATPVYTLTTFGSANYTVTPVNGTFTITGNAPQTITFAALPNFPHGSSYQLTARSSSGLAVTYAVTAGSASISGSTLTVTGTGTVTVQATQTGNGNYAAAPPVSRSFTAQ